MTTRRSKSEFDPDELAKITHKGLHTLKRGDDPRCTLQQLSTLKSQELEQEVKPGVQARRQLEHFLHSVSSSVRGLFAPKMKKHVQCDLYGHALIPGWTGDFPICVDCGGEITSTSMVRGATPHAQDALDNSGRWKRVQ